MQSSQRNRLQGRHKLQKILQQWSDQLKPILKGHQIDDEWLRGGSLLLKRRRGHADLCPEANGRPRQSRNVRCSGHLQQLDQQIRLPKLLAPHLQANPNEGHPLLRPGFQHQSQSLHGDDIPRREGSGSHHRWYLKPTECVSRYDRWAVHRQACGPVLQASMIQVCVC